MTRGRTVALALALLTTTGVIAAAPVAEAAIPTTCLTGARPSAPTLRAAAAGDGLRVTWDRVPDADSYLARYSWTGVASDGTVYTGPADSTWQTTTDPATGVTVTAPADATRVTVEVAAANGCGDSERATWAGPRSSPPAPRSVAAFPGRTNMIVSWIPGHPRSAPNYADARYVATVQPGGHTCAVEPDAPNQCTVTGLSLGDTYTVSVQGTNELGNGAVGVAPKPVTLAYGPTPPRAIRVSTTRTAARVSWTPPRSTGGGPIRGYRVTSEPGGRSCRTTGLSCTVTGLMPGTIYRFLVVARNRTVEGFPGRSTAVSTLSPPSLPKPTPTPTPTDPAKPPQDLRARADRLATPVQDAARANADARSLRKDVAALLGGYIAEYGGRFTPAERQQLTGYRADADRKLSAVVLTTARLSRALSGKATATERRVAASAAQAAWSRARAAADASWTSARQIMEPRLSLFEKVGALNDYNDMMDRFDALGRRIDSAAASTRTRQ